MSYVVLMGLRVADAVVDPAVGADALGDGHEVVGAGVEVHQVDHVSERTCHTYRVRVGQSVVKVVEKLPERLDLEQGITPVYKQSFTLVFFFFNLLPQTSK